MGGNGAPWLVGRAAGAGMGVLPSSLPQNASKASAGIDPVLTADTRRSPPLGLKASSSMQPETYPAFATDTGTIHLSSSFSLSTSLRSIFVPQW